jgi:hypothetical protein
VDTDKLIHLVDREKVHILFGDGDKIIIGEQRQMNSFGGQ